MKTLPGKFARKGLAAVMEKIKPADKIEEYAKKRLEVCSKLFPSLPRTELNLLVMAGLEEKDIKKLVKQKDSDEETFLYLCSSLDEINTPAASSS